MSKYWVPFFFIAVFFSGCNKVEKTQRTLTGVWNVHQYKFTTSTGFSYYYESEGTMDFGSCDGELCNYALNFIYQNQGSQSKIESGTIDVDENNNFQLNRLNPDGTSTLIEYGRIILLTKDDLKMEFADETGLHEFVLLK